MSKKLVWAARPFGYGEYPMLDVGQVIEVDGSQRNDEKLLRLGLLREVGAVQPVECGRCGARFMDEGHLNRHGKNQHAKTLAELGRSEAPQADLDSAEQLGKLKALEASDEFAERNIPLDLEKTKASRGEGKSRARASR